MAPTESNQQRYQQPAASRPPSYIEPNRSEPHQTSPHLTSPHPALALLFACHMRVRKDFRFMLLLANFSSPPYPAIVSPPTRFVIVLLGKCRAHGECHVFFAKLMTDSIYIIYNPLPSFSSNFGIQKLFAYNSIAYITKEPQFCIKKNNNEEVKQDILLRMRISGIY